MCADRCSLLRRRSAKISQISNCRVSSIPPRLLTLKVRCRRQRAVSWPSPKINEVSRWRTFWTVNDETSFSMDLRDLFPRRRIAGDRNICHFGTTKIISLYEDLLGCSGQTLATCSMARWRVGLYLSSQSLGSAVGLAPVLRGAVTHSQAPDPPVTSIAFLTAVKISAAVRRNAAPTHGDRWLVAVLLYLSVHLFFACAAPE